MTNWTKDQLILAGDEIRRLTKSKGFGTAVTLLREDYTNRITQSQYGDSEGREANYRKLVALDDLLGVMNTLALQARELQLVEGLDDEDSE